MNVHPSAKRFSDEDEESVSPFRPFLSRRIGPNVDHHDGTGFSRGSNSRRRDAHAELLRVVRPISGAKTKGWSGIPISCEHVRRSTPGNGVRMATGGTFHERMCLGVRARDREVTPDMGPVDHWPQQVMQINGHGGAPGLTILRKTLTVSLQRYENRMPQDHHKQ